MLIMTKNLREAVLEAAIQGRLTKTLESDTPVSQTMSYFKYEKDKLLKSKKMKDRNIFEPINEHEYYFDIPDSWSWVRINDIGVYKKGPFGSALTKSMFVSKSDSTVKVYEQKNAIQKNEKIGEYYISKDYYESKMTGFAVEGGDILVSCAGTIGETFIMPDEIEVGIINQALMRMNIIKSINTKYFMLVFDHILKSEAKSKSGGTAIKNIPPFEVFKAMPIPLPPIEEQGRIVSRVEELMMHLDEYEIIENHLAKIHRDFPSEMKDSILQAAMEGKLTKHINFASSSKDYLDFVTQRLNITKPIRHDLIEKPYDDLPESWTYTCLKNICEIQTGKRDANFGDENGVFPFFTCAKNPIKSKTYSYDMNAILIAGNGDIGNISRFNGKFEAYQRTYILKINDNLNDKFIYYAIKDRWLRYNKDKMFGSAIPYVRLGNLDNYSIPFPPKEEQKYIVDLLDKVLPLCDSFEID
jgi:type I restriction enzyme, S subunit